MPIRINLLAEAQAAEEMRRKDPVKRSIWIGAFVVAVVLIISATLQCKIMSERSEVSSLQLRWKTIESQVQEVNDQRSRKRDIEQKLSALDQFTTNRLLWANALDALQRTPVANVQLTRMHTEQVFTLIEAPAPKTGETPKPSSVIEKTVVMLEGRDYLNGEQVPRFKEAIATQPYFQDHLQQTNKVQLTSLSAPQTDSGRHYRDFGFQLFFQEKERRLHE
jgi:hypothetical protein